MRRAGLLPGILLDGAGGRNLYGFHTDVRAHTPAGPAGALPLLIVCSDHTVLAE